MKINSILDWEGSYIKFEIEGSDSQYCEGDMFWCGKEGDTEILLIHETVSRKDVDVWAREMNLESSQRKVLLGMLTQAGVI